MKQHLLFTTCLSAIIILSACTSTPPKQLTRDHNAIGGKGVHQIQGKTWIATEIKGFKVVADSNARNLPSIQFGTDNRVSGSDGCNRIMGSYEADSMYIKFGQVATTQMMCQNSNNAVAQTYAASLQDVAKYKVSNTTLTLEDSSGNVLIKYTTSVQPR